METYIVMRLLFKITICMRDSLKKLAKVLIGEKRLKKLLYDFKNADEFTSILYHETMLCDSARVEGYYKGIQRAVRPGDVVVDVGTGTGILSFFAAQKNPQKIYAIDHSSIISVAELVAEHNGITNIEFVRTNSKDFSLDEKVDVILHEQIGQCLFGENMVEHLLDLKRRLLKSSGRILPARFELFVEPVALKQEYRTPYLWEQRIHGVDFSCTKDSRDVEKLKKPSYHLKNVRNREVEYFLAAPEPVLCFDLNDIDSEDEIPRSFDVSRCALKEGVVDGYCIYFRVIFDDETSFDNSPMNPQTNWWNGILRSERRKYRPGDSISYTFHMGDLNDMKQWSLKVK